MARRIRTFLDSGVLIAAFKGTPQLRELALQILEDPDRVFVTSPFVRLEVLPKAIFNKQVNETLFYEQFFARAVHATGRVPDHRRAAEVDSPVIAGQSRLPFR